MRYSNLHTHTIFSDGRYTPEENVLEAVKRNMTSIGFSDHSYTDFDLRFGIRPQNTAAYAREIRRLQKKYRDELEIYLGLELDGFSKLENRELYDYIIGDCHYIKIDNEYFTVDDSREEQQQVIDRYFDKDAMKYARAYFDVYTEKTIQHKPDILGHFDLVAKFDLMDENSNVYKIIASQALAECLKVTPFIELNTGPVCRRVRKVPYPTVFILKEILRRKGKIVLSSDSHEIENMTFWFDEAVSLLKSIGFKSIVQMKNNKFEETGL